MVWEEYDKKYDDGYDSIGEQGPLFDAINIEVEKDFDENEVVKEVTDCSDILTDSEDSTSETPRYDAIPPDVLKKLKVSDLK